jgi:hypothetical protein
MSRGAATDNASWSRCLNRTGLRADHRLEDSSGNRRRLGHITKQGSSMMRFFRWKRRR